MVASGAAYYSQKSSLNFPSLSPPFQCAFITDTLLHLISKSLLNQSIL